MYTLNLPPNFSFNECLLFLDRGYDDCLHKVQDGLVFKLINIAGQLEFIAVGQEHDTLCIETFLDSKISSEQIITYVTEWLDLSRDLEPFHALLATNKPYDQLLAYKDLKLIGIADLFEALCWSIIGQQINLSFAYKLKRNLVELCGKHHEFGGRKYYVFPSPADVLRINREELLALQFSRQKADYILLLAQAFEDNKISKSILIDIASHQEQVAFLKSFKGIGEWTAQYTLMKTLKNMEAIPYGDSGINQASHNIIGIPKKDSRSLQEQEFAKFPKWQNYFSFYLWRSLYK